MAYILGSHNSWSYLTPTKWWMRIIAFTARCQCIDIKQQYAMGVRCFDLRIRYDKGTPVIAHGIIVYNIDLWQLHADLKWLNERGDCYVRLIHEVRTKRQYKSDSKNFFQSFCTTSKSDYPSIRFWCGRNLYNWEKDYDFGDDPTCEEKYASVCPPRWVDDWWPWLFARFHNHSICETGTDQDILLIDFVDIN